MDYMLNTVLLAVGSFGWTAAVVGFFIVVCSLTSLFLSSPPFFPSLLSSRYPFFNLFPFLFLIFIPLLCDIVFVFTFALFLFYFLLLLFVNSGPVRAKNDPVPTLNGVCRPNR